MTDTTQEALDRLVSLLQEKQSRAPYYDDTCKAAIDTIRTLHARAEAAEAELAEMTAVKDIHAKKRHEYFEQAEALSAKVAEGEAERELVRDQLLVRANEVITALRRAEAAEAERDRLWAAMEQVSSGTIMLNGKRHDISADEDVFEWADQLIFGTRNGFPEISTELDGEEE